MNKCIELFGVMVAVATFSSSAFAGKYVATYESPATVSASVESKVSRSGEYLVKYDPPADAQGNTYSKWVPTTVKFVWQANGVEPAPPVDIYQRAIVDVDLKTFASHPSVTSTAEVQSSAGINRSINSGNQKTTFTTGEVWFGKMYPAQPYTQTYEVTTNVSVRAKASVDTTFAPPGSSGTSQSSIALKMSEARFNYGQPAGTAATASEPGVVGRGGP